MFWFYVGYTLSKTSSIKNISSAWCTDFYWSYCYFAARVTRQPTLGPLAKVYNEEHKDDKDDCALFIHEQAQDKFRESSKLDPIWSAAICLTDNSNNLLKRYHACGLTDKFPLQYDEKSSIHTFLFNANVRLSRKIFH